MKKLIANQNSLRFGDVLKQQLCSNEWIYFKAAIAFIKKSGVKYIENELLSFLSHGKAIITVGIDLKGTSYDGLELLIECIGEKGEIYVFHNESQSTFHPKLYMFCNDTKALVLIGSGNLTEGGLYINYEIGVMLQLDLTNIDDKIFYEEINEVFKLWTNTKDGICYKLTPHLLAQLKELDLVDDERTINAKAGSISSSQKDKNQPNPLFKRIAINSPPYIAKQNEDDSYNPLLNPSCEITYPNNEVFLMTLQNTDVGKGQLNPNSSRRSPEIFIPLSARDANPSFWDWPNNFFEYENRHTRESIPVIMGNERFSINMMAWHLKHDFRIRSEKLRSAGQIGDILLITKLKENPEAEYQIRILSQNSLYYQIILAKCTNSVKNSNKRWGYSTIATLQNAGFSLSELNYF